MIIQENHLHLQELHNFEHLLLEIAVQYLLAFKIMLILFIIDVNLQKSDNHERTCQETVKLKHIEAIDFNDDSQSTYSHTEDKGYVNRNLYLVD